MDWHVFKADKSRKKWSIRGTLHNGENVKIPGHHNKKIAEMMCRNIDQLNCAALSGDLLPDAVIKWLNRLPSKFLERLIALGLVDHHRRASNCAIAELLKPFREHLEAKCEDNDSKYPGKAIGMLRKVFEAMPSVTAF